MPSPIGVVLTANVGNFTRGMSSAVSSFNQLEYTASNVSRNAPKAAQAAFHGVGIAAGSGLMAGMGMMNLGKALIGATSAAIDEATSFNTRLREMAGITGEEFGSAFIQGMDKKITNAAMESVFSPGEMAGAVTTLLTQGIQKADVEGAFSAVGNMAEASFGKLSIEKAAQMSAVALQKFNVEGANTEQQFKRIGDMFTALRTNTTMDWGDMMGWMSSMKAAAAILDTTSTEQILALSGALKSSGQTARSSGQNINMIARNVIKMTQQMRLGGEGSKKFQASLQVLNMTMDDLVYSSGPNKGKAKDLISILSSLKRASDEAIASGKDASLVNESLFNFTGTKTGIDFLKAMDKIRATMDDGTQVTGLKALDVLVKKIENSEGITDRLVKEFRASFGGQIKIASGVFNTILKTIGKQMIKELVPPLKMAVSLMRTFAAFLEANPAAAKAIAKAFLVLGAGLIAVGGVITFISASVLIVAGIIAGMPVVVNALAAAFSATGAMVAGVVVGMVAIATLIGTVAAKSGILSKVLTGAKDAFLIAKGITKMLSQGTLGEGFLSTDETAELSARGILGTFIDIWQIVTRIGYAWKAFTENSDLKDAMKSIGKELDGILTEVAKAFDTIFPTKLFQKLLSTSDTDLTIWEKLGSVLGTITSYLLQGVVAFLATIRVGVVLAKGLLTIVRVIFDAISSLVFDIAAAMSQYKSVMTAIGIVVGTVTAIFTVLAVIIGVALGAIAILAAALVSIPFVLLGFALAVVTFWVTMGILVRTAVMAMVLELWDWVSGVGGALDSLAQSIYDAIQYVSNLMFGSDKQSGTAGAKPEERSWWDRMWGGDTATEVKPVVTPGKGPDVAGAAAAATPPAPKVDIKADNSTHINGVTLQSTNPEELMSKFENLLESRSKAKGDTNMRDQYGYGGTSGY